MARRSRRARSRRPARSPIYLIVLLAAVVLAAVGVRVSPELAAWLPAELRAVLAPGPAASPEARRGAPPAPTNLPRTAKSFAEAKRVLYDDIYRDHRLTFYCGCRYTVEKQADLSSCGVVPRKNAERASRVEAEHVFPAAQFGNFRPCWREPRGFPACVKSDGKPLSGRQCCETVDPVFKSAHNDLHNLFPAEGEINGDRRDYNWGMVSGERREHGTCNIEVDPSIRRAEPPDNVMGDIARTLFYMADTYQFRLSDQDRQLFTAWSRQDPPGAWEIERNQRIKAVQGRGNRFIEDYARVFGQTAVKK